MARPKSTIEKTQIEGFVRPVVPTETTATTAPFLGRRHLIYSCAGKKAGEELKVKSGGEEYFLQRTKIFTIYFLQQRIRIYILVERPVLSSITSESSERRGMSSGYKEKVSHLNSNVEDMVVSIHCFHFKSKRLFQRLYFFIYFYFFMLSLIESKVGLKYYFNTPVIVNREKIKAVLVDCAANVATNLRLPTLYDLLIQV